ncbi:7317_t:CDS:2, partial [Acaulospora morrowiae]
MSSYPPYKRSAEKQPQRYDRNTEGNPFLRSTSSASSVLGDSQFSQFSQSETSDRPFKRSRVEVDLSERRASPITPSRKSFNFIPDLRGLKDSIFSQGSLNSISSTSPKLVKDLSETRLKIASLEYTKNDFESKIARLETDKQNLELQIKELNLSIE